MIEIESQEPISKKIGFFDLFLCLTLYWFRAYSMTMKTLTVKTYIKRLIKKFGKRRAVAQELGVTLRYIYMLEKGEKVPSDHLRKLIKAVLK